MAIRTVTNAIQDIIHSIIGGKTKRTHYLKFMLIGLSVVGVATGGFFSYRWYIMYRERSAYKALTNYLEDYRRTLQEGQGDWAPVEDLFKLGYEQHSNSDLAPFFLVFEADALIKQDKKQEAIEIFDKMLNNASDKDPLIPLFQLKRALLKLDGNDNATKESGVQDLINLSNDRKNYFNDVALYYLGQYYFANDRLDDAKKTWQQLVEQEKHEKIMGSPWAQLAQQKLDQLA